MAGLRKAISLKEAVDFCINSDGSDLDSSMGGMSSGEEEELDRELGYFDDSGRYVMIFLLTLSSAHIKFCLLSVLTL